jgi:hypothetical protein
MDWMDGLDMDTVFQEQDGLIQTTESGLPLVLTSDVGEGFSRAAHSAGGSRKFDHTFSPQVDSKSSDGGLLPGIYSLSQDISLFINNDNRLTQLFVV